MSFYDRNGSKRPRLLVNEDDTADSLDWHGLGITQGQVWSSRGATQDTLTRLILQITQGVEFTLVAHESKSSDTLTQLKRLVSALKGLDPSSAALSNPTRKDIYLASFRVNAKPVQVLWWDQRSVLNVINTGKSSYTESGNQYNAGNLLSTTRFWFWASQPGGFLENTFVFNTFKEIKTINKLVFYNSVVTNRDPSTATKELKVWVSTDGDTWTPVSFASTGSNKVTLNPPNKNKSNAEEPQIFTLSQSVQARYIKVTTLSNYGNPSQISLNKVQAFEPDQTVTMPVEQVRTKVTNLMNGDVREYDTPSHTLTITINRDPMLIEGL